MRDEADLVGGLLPRLLDRAAAVAGEQPGGGAHGLGGGAADLAALAQIPAQRHVGHDRNVLERLVPEQPLVEHLAEAIVVGARQLLQHRHPLRGVGGEIGIVADREQMPDLWSLMGWLGEALEELRHLAQE